MQTIHHVRIKIIVIGFRIFSFLSFALANKEPDELRGGNEKENGE